MKNIIVELNVKNHQELISVLDELGWFIDCKNKVK